MLLDYRYFYAAKKSCHYQKENRTVINTCSERQFRKLLSEHHVVIKKTNWCER